MIYAGLMGIALTISFIMPFKSSDETYIPYEFKDLKVLKK